MGPGPMSWPRHTTSGGQQETAKTSSRRICAAPAGCCVTRGAPGRSPTHLDHQSSSSRSAAKILISALISARCWSSGRPDPARGAGRSGRSCTDLRGGWPARYRPARRSRPGWAGCSHTSGPRHRRMRRELKADDGPEGSRPTAAVWVRSLSRPKGSGSARGRGEHGGLCLPLPWSSWALPHTCCCGTGRRPGPRGS